MKGDIAAETKMALDECLNAVLSAHYKVTVSASSSGTQTVKAINLEVVVADIP